MDATPLIQSIAFLSKIENSAKQAKKLIEKGSIESLPKLYAELQICKTWVYELVEVEESLDDLISVVSPRQTLESQEGNKNAQLNIDRIIVASSKLSQNIGLLPMIELVNNIVHSSAKALRELKGLLKELQQEV